MSKKITELPAAASLAVNDVIPVVSVAGPTTQKATVAVLRVAILPASLTSEVSGILPVANGGTGSSSLPAGGLAGQTAMAFGDAASESNANVFTGTAITTERSAARTLTNASMSGAANTFTAIPLTTAVSGVLPTANGGWSASAAETLTNKTIAGASNTLTVRIANDVSGLGAGVATFLGTPSGANLAAALTTALPDTKGGTGITALGAGVATLLAAAPTGTVALVGNTSPTFRTGVLLNNPANTFAYTFTPAAIAAARTITLPLLAGNDTMVCEAFAQTLTNKTAVLASNTITDTSQALGDIAYCNGTRFVRFARGTTAGQSLTATATTIAYSSNPGVAAQAVAALAIDWATGQVFTKTLSAGANTFTFSNATSGLAITVRVTGAASTLTWPTVKWAGGVAPTQTASGTDVYTFVHDGTSIYGSVVQAMA